MAQAVGPTGYQPVPSADDGFDIKAVEQALADLWHEEDRATGTPDTVRACSANFIIPVAPGGYDAWQNRLAGLARLVPSRIILLEEAPAGSKPAIDAHVTATCHRRKGGTLVCSEMVHIRSVPPACPRLPSICRALAISDLPLYHLALDQTGMDPQAIHALFELADLTVVDSEKMAGSLWSSDPVYCDGDLVWPRLTPWRTAVGHFISTCEVFDAVHIDRMEITGSRASAPLFAGWLSGLLRWRWTSEERAGARVSTDAGSPVRVAFDYVESGDGIARLMLGKEDSGDPQLTVTARADGFAIDARVRGARIESSVAIHPLSFAQEVAEIVHSQGADEIYRRARRLALTLLSAQA